MVRAVGLRTGTHGVPSDWLWSVGDQSVARYQAAGRSVSYLEDEAWSACWKHMDDLLQQIVAESIAPIL